MNMNWALSARSYLPTVRKWRWDLIAVGAVALAAGIASTHPSAYFLHFDTPTQDMAALEWAHGCWEWNTEKILPVMLLGLLFKIFPPSPYVETVVLLLFMATSATTAYELTRSFTQSNAGSWFTVLLLLSLPAYQYFARSYLGYQIPFLLLGWLAVWHNRWGWAGLCFGLAVTAHFSSIVPLAFSVVALSIFFLRAVHWKKWLTFMAAGAVPVIVADAIFFAYLGRPFAWSMGSSAVLLRLSNYVADPHPNWFWVAESMFYSNGLLPSLLLALGILAPVALRRNQSGLAFSISFMGWAGFYTIQAGIGRAILLSKILTPLYAFWAVGVGVVVWRIVNSLPLLSQRRIATSISIVVPAIIATQTTAFIRSFSQTLYPNVEQAIAHAAEENRPVRYFGSNIYAALFFARAYGVEMLVGNNGSASDTTLGNAVLIFEGHIPDAMDQQDYAATTFDITTETGASYTIFPALTEAAILQASQSRRVETWWPSSAHSEPAIFAASSGFPNIYFSGSGCVTKPWFGDGTMHFYQLAWSKVTNALFQSGR